MGNPGDKHGTGLDQAELLEHILTAWGGARQLALDLKEAYDAAKPGSPTRARILEFVMGKMAKQNEQPENLSPMSRVDLLGEIKRIVHDSDDDATDLENPEDMPPESKPEPKPKRKPKKA